MDDQERMVACRRWARWMYEADMAFQIYQALRDGVNQWGDLTDEQLYVAPGFYGSDWPDGWDEV